MNHVLKTLLQSSAIAAGLLTGGTAVAEKSDSIGAAIFNNQGELVLPVAGGPFGQPVIPVPRSR